MSKHATSGWSLENDTAVNVATLLREEIGASRRFPITLDRIALDDDLVARDVTGELRLTRLPDAILARVDASAVVALECQRCLDQYDQAVDIRFDEEFRVAYDVRNGSEIKPEADDDERFTISEKHEVDIREPLRQEFIVGLPMRPTCGPDCQGPPAIQDDDEDQVGPVDNRFAALAGLLDERDDR